MKFCYFCEKEHTTNTACCEECWTLVEKEYIGKKYETKQK